MKFKKVIFFVMALVIGSLAAAGIFASIRPSEAEFVVTSLDCPAEAKVGERITVTAYVANRRGAEETYTVTLTVTVDGKETEGGTGEVTVPGGEARPVQFALTFNIAGNYEIEVDGVSRTLEVTPAQ